MLSAHAVTIRPLDTSDADMLGELENRLEVREYIGRVSKPPSGIFAIQFAGRTVGIVGIVQTDSELEPTVKLICALLSDAEGKGLAEAACRRALASVPPSVRAIAAIKPGNTRSQRLAQRLGFVLSTAQRTEWGEEVWELSPAALAAHTAAG